MKKLLLILTASLVLGGFVPLAVFAAGTAETKVPEPSTVTLPKGLVKVYPLGKITLHAYRTNDFLSDESYLLETEKNLVAIESPAFHSNLKELVSYARGLNKPLTDVLVAYHPNGTEYFETSQVHLASTTARSLEVGGEIRGLIDTFTKAFGSDFDGNLPTVKADLIPGKTTVGGIDFVVTETGTAYDLEIPAIHSVYTHMLGADVHSIVAGPEHQKALLETLGTYKKRGFALVLTSHHEPETLSAVDTKVAYLKKLGELATTAQSGEEFTSAAKAAFPGYAGENYLAMTAAAFFPAK